MKDPMPRRLSLFWLVILLAYLTSCGNKEQKAVIEDECLVGTWEVTDSEAFLRSLIPPGAFEEDSLRYRGESSKVGYTFQENGVLLFQALNWMSFIDVEADRTLYPLVFTLEGFASAEYNLEGDKIKVGQVNEGQINLVATLDDEEMLNSSKASEFVPLFVAPHNFARYVCLADELTLEITNASGVTRPITLKRVE